MSSERPLIIGVVGGSGSGKTTVTRAIYDLPGIDAAFIDQDAYYRDLSHLPLEERKKVNYDHPDAFDTELLVQQLTALTAGEAVDMPVQYYVDPKILDDPIAKDIGEITLSYTFNEARYPAAKPLDPSGAAR